jgi:threonine dehydrogenase-like Zn-dependent dehydrogenase
MASGEFSRIGYEWVGRVTGSAGVTDLNCDLVHLPFHHSQMHTFKVGQQTMVGKITPLPQGIEPEAAIFLALAGVALQAIHDAQIKVGDRVAIFGLGAIGLLGVQLAKLNGAAWVDAIDPLPARREWAQRLGADQTYDPLAGDGAYAIKSSSPEHGADIAIEMSGNYAALNEAIRVVRKAGKVVAAGFYRGGGTPLQLGAEWHHNRVTMVSSMGVWENPTTIAVEPGASTRPLRVCCKWSTAHRRPDQPPDSVRAGGRRHFDRTARNVRKSY